MREKFFNYLSYNICYSNQTVAKYRRVLKKLDSFLQLRGKSVDIPEDITLEDVSDFIADIIEQWLTPSYCNWLIVGIKSYLNYLRDVMYMDIFEPHKIRYCKVPDRNVGYYNEKQKRQIINTVKSWFWYNWITRLRNQLLVYMLLHTWLRCHELIKIKVSDIGEALQIVGKWGKRRVVYLRKELLDMIQEYLQKRKKESDYLFPNRTLSKWHITDSAVRWILNKMGHKLGFSIHPHAFRHTFATDLMVIPWSNIFNVSKLLGHSNINTTKIYLWLNDWELKKLQFWLKF